MKLTEQQRDRIAEIMDRHRLDVITTAKAINEIEAALQTHMTAEEQAALAAYAKEIEG